MATILGTGLLRSGARPEQGLHQSPSDRSLLAYLSFAGRKVAFQEMHPPPALKDADKLVDLDPGGIEYLAFKFFRHSFAYQAVPHINLKQ